MDEGKLSRLQLEGIKYACAKHLEWLPSGEREDPLPCPFPLPPLPPTFSRLACSHRAKLKQQSTFVCPLTPQPAPASVAGAGFFIGDGAGVGKGRQISGIILDNFARGRRFINSKTRSSCPTALSHLCPLPSLRRHLWVSTSSDLHADAIRDLRDIGCHMPVIGSCQELDRETRALGLSKDFQEGVLFV